MSFDTAKVNLGDPRLHHVFWMRGSNCAAVEDYARASGLSVMETLTHLTPIIESGVVTLEAVEDTLFVDTAPAGRPSTDGRPQVPAGLWEMLKQRAGKKRAQALWRLIRGLEAGGWQVVTDTAVLTKNIKAVPVQPWLGVVASGQPVVLVPYPDPEELASRNGPLEVLAAAGATSVALTCHNNALSDLVTATRAWALGRQHHRRIQVYILEAPRFAPTALEVDDRGVFPVSVVRDDR